MKIPVTLLSILLTVCKVTSKRIQITVTHTVECTSEGMSKIEYYSRVKRESRLFKDTLTKTGSTIKDALDSSMSAGRKQAQSMYDSSSDSAALHRSMAGRTVDTSQSSYSKSKSVSASVGLWGSFKKIAFGASGSGGSSKTSTGSKLNHRERDFSSINDTAHSTASTESRDQMQEISDSISRAMMMERDLSDTRQHISEWDQASEKENKTVKQYQSDRFQQWRRYTKTISINGQHQTEESFLYVYDSADEITKTELKACAVDYLNDYILAGTGFETSLARVSNTFSFEAPDLLEETPRNIVVMWSGSIDQIPFGWLLCDGSNGTPDLRSKFVIGAYKSQGLDVDQIGGSNEKKLTTNELPRHNHGASVNEHSHSMDSRGSHTHSIHSAGSHAHKVEHVKQVRHKFIPHPNYIGDYYYDIVNSEGGDAIKKFESWGFRPDTSTTGSHSHSMSSSGNHNHNINSNRHTHTITSTGAGQSFDNRPAFYSLAFIMKKE
jgi:hypothetical protein